jgi:glycosyltransferase involved in cell wall biosynthesis
MRIAIASSGLGHITRGVEAWAADLGHALATKADKVILCKGGGDVEAGYERVLPCCQRMAPKTQRLAQWTKHGLWRLGLSSTYELEEASFAWHLIKLLRRDAIDILHVQDPHVALLVQHANRIGWVRTRTILGHGTNEPYSFLGKIRYLQHLAPYYLEEAKSAGCWKPTWSAIPNFIDTDSFQPTRNGNLRSELGIPSDSLVVLCAAAIKRDHKRVHHLLSEFRCLLQKNPTLPVWLVVAGGREADTDELVAWGRENLGDRVRFLIQFPRARMPQLYSSANVFALCSLREMMPIVLLEATASGLPCLVHPHPLLQWESGPGGMAVNMETPGALADGMLHLLLHEDLRKDLGRKGREYCLATFSRDRVIDQILSYYNFVLTHDRRAG